MKSLRWGLVVSMVGGALVLGGCQQAMQERIRTLEGLNKDQASIISQLTMDKERLTVENTRLVAELDKSNRLLSAQDELMKDMQGRAKTVTSDTPDGTDTITVRQGKVGVILGISSDLLFDSGSATLKPQGQKVLKEAAGMIADKPNKIAVWGFTDSDPIKHSGWKDNFDLSGARSRAVLDELKKDGIAPERMHFSGFGEYALVMKDGKEDKKKSRRAEIVLLNDPEGLTGDRAAAPAPAKTTPKPAPRPMTPK